MALTSFNPREEEEKKKEREGEWTPAAALYVYILFSFQFSHPDCVCNIYRKIMESKKYNGLENIFFLLTAR